MILSVIVPIYNTSSYLEECISSIICQNVEDMEILLINDCSNDNSIEIAKNLATADKRIRVINLEENIGLGFVRNMGIAEAQGKWLAFVDSDDIMQPNSLDQLIQYGELQDSQVVLGGVVRQIDDGTGAYSLSPFGLTTKNVPIVGNTCLEQYPDLIDIAPCWSMIYRRDFLTDNNIKFLRRFQEDHDFGLHVMLEATRVSLRKDIPYIRYRVRHVDQSSGNLSITQQRWDVERCSMMFSHLARVISLLTNDKYKETTPSITEYRRTRFSYYLGVFANNTLRNFLPSKELTKQEKESLFEQVRSLFESMDLNSIDIDHSVEPIARHNRLSKIGYYELVYNLVLAGEREALEFLVLNKMLKQVNAAELLARPTDNKDLYIAIEEFVFANSNTIASGPNEPTRLIPSTVEEIILHIGTTKTGSTSIQNFFEKNRESLKLLDIVYPKTGVYYDKRENLVRTSGHQGLLMASYKNDHQFINRFYTELAGIPNAKRVIISAENLFHQATPGHIENIKAMISGVKTKIVVYLRRQDRWIESMYNETICGGHAKETRNFGAFVRANVAAGRLDYNDILKNWAEVFGQENIIVRSYEKSTQNGLLDDFCNICNIQSYAAFERLNEVESNRSILGKKQLLLLRSINKLQFASKSEGYQKFVHHFIDRAGYPKERQRIGWFDVDDRKDLMDKMFSTNKEIARLYNNSEDLFLELDTKDLEENFQTRDKIIEIELDELEAALELYSKYCNIGAPSTKAQKPVKQVPLDFESSFALGCRAYHEGRFTDAQKCFRQARKIKNKNVNVMRCQAETEVKLGNNLRATEILKNAVRLLPSNKSLLRRYYSVRFSKSFGLFYNRPFPVPRKQ